MWHDTVGELAASVRRYTAGRSPGANVPDAVNEEITGLEEMGVFDLVPTSSLGTASSAFPYVAAVGRELAGSPVAAAFWNATATRIALATVRSALLPADPDVEVAEEGARCDVRLTQPADGGCSARADGSARDVTPGSSWIVSGEVPGVLGAEGARRILVRARLQGAPGDCREGVLLVDGTEGGMVSRSSWAGTALTTIHLRDQRGVLVAAGEERAVASALEHALSRAAALQSVDLVAIARRCLADTITHLQARQQFGRPLASLPVVRSHLADAHIDVTVSDAVAGVALASLAESVPGLRVAETVGALAARLSVQRRTEHVVLLSNQLTGGVGYYDDYPLAALTREFMVRSRLFGRAADLRSVAERLLVDSGFRVETARSTRNASHLSGIGATGVDS